jgi:hypothetical protein
MPARRSGPLRKQSRLPAQIAARLAGENVTSDVTIDDRGRRNRS